MRSKQLAENPKTLVIVLDTRRRDPSSLRDVAQAKHLGGSSFKAIGALPQVRTTRRPLWELKS